MSTDNTQNNNDTSYLKEYLFHTNDYITAYIKFADNKAAAVLGLVTLLAGGLFKITVDFLPILKNYTICCQILLLLCPAVTATMILLTIWKVLATRLPRTYSAKPSYFSFPYLAEQNVENLSKEMLEMTEATALQHLNVQNKNLSDILNSKFAAQKSSFLFLLISVFALAATAISFVVVNLYG